LIRASTPLFRALDRVDARDKPGQDETMRPSGSLIPPQNFSRTALRESRSGFPGLV
jgi:hypothetical protein